MAYKNAAILTVICIIVIIIILLLIVSHRRKRKWDQKKEIKKTLFSETINPEAQLPTLIETKEDINNFKEDFTDIDRRKFSIFNPNGIEINGFKYVVFRCSNAELRPNERPLISYPVLHKYENNFDAPVETKILTLTSHRPVVETQEFKGFEDTRLFNHKGRLYLIGVNYDRSNKKVPSMALVKVDSDFNTRRTWHLSYSPIDNVPNKNWSPLTLPNGELGFIVDIDPLLIVKRSINSYGKYDERCELAYSEWKQTNISRMRNSTITYGWNDVPNLFKPEFDSLAGVKPDNTNRYVLMGHTKYVESEFKENGKLILYQQYFVVIDIPVSNPKGCKVYPSKPIYVENSYKEHRAYISGMLFSNGPNPELILMYGIVDEESRYIKLSPEKLSKILH